MLCVFLSNSRIACIQEAVCLRQNTTMLRHMGRNTGSHDFAQSDCAAIDSRMQQHTGGRMVPCANHLGQERSQDAIILISSSEPFLFWLASAVNNACKCGGTCTKHDRMRKEANCMARTQHANKHRQCAPHACSDHCARSHLRIIHRGHAHNYSGSNTNPMTFCIR